MVYRVLILDDSREDRIFWLDVLAESAHKAQAKIEDVASEIHTLHQSFNFSWRVLSVSSVPEITNVFEPDMSTAVRSTFAFYAFGAYLSWLSFPFVATAAKHLDMHEACDLDVDIEAHTDEMAKLEYFIQSCGIALDKLNDTSSQDFRKAITLDYAHALNNLRKRRKRLKMLDGISKENRRIHDNRLVQAKLLSGSPHVIVARPWSPTKNKLFLGVLNGRYGVFFAYGASERRQLIQGDTLASVLTGNGVTYIMHEEEPDSCVWKEEQLDIHAFGLANAVAEASYIVLPPAGL